MCNNCSNGSCGGVMNGGCVVVLITKILLIVGGLNWGLTGVGMMIGSNLNVVNMILGSMPMIEAIIYIVVGIAAIVSIFGCSCAKCKSCCAESAAKPM